MGKKIAVITGASSGMGREFVIQLCNQKQFDEVWVIARRTDRLESLSAEVSTSIRPVSLDLTKKESIEAYRQLLEAEKRCAKMESETKILCAEMVTKAKAESQAYWEEVQNKLEAFYQAHAGLRELLSILVPKTGGM